MSYYIGLMSGTSADGMDCTLNCFDNGTKLIATHSINYSPTEQNWLRAAACKSQISWQEMAELDNWVAQKSAQAVLELLAKTNISAKEIQAIGSHGHTFCHQPKGNKFSWQLGNGHLIAELTGINCINDFRRRDIAAGGEGAPLACGFHQHLLTPQQRPAVLLNIGGMANLTYITCNQEIIGLDTGPGNCLLDEVCQKQLKQPFDINGKIAQSGQIQPNLLKLWLDDDYFHASAPKSTGREHFNLANFVGSTELISTPDLLATLVELSASSIALAVNTYACEAKCLYVCGGGAKNEFLLQRLAILSGKKVETTSALNINPQWVEASAFAWLAYCFMHNKSSSCTKMTGAKHASLLGALHKA